MKYTRIETSYLLDRVAHGDSIEEITGYYHGRVSREAVAEAIEITNRFFADNLLPLMPQATAAANPSTHLTYYIDHCLLN